MNQLVGRLRSAFVHMYSVCTSWYVRMKNDVCKKVEEEEMKEEDEIGLLAKNSIG